MKLPLVFALTSISALAGINSCPVTTGSLNRTFTGGPTYSNVVVPGATTGPLFSNSIGTLGTAGCTTIDLTFSNFALSSTGSNEGNLPSAAGTYLSVTPTGTTQTVPDTLLFATLQGNGTSTDNTENDGVDNFKVNNSESFTSTMSYSVADSVGTGVLGVMLTVNDITISTGGSGSVTIDACSNGATVITGSITSAAQCTAASSGAVFSTATITLAQLASQSATLAFASHPTYVDITQVISLTCSSCGSDETGFLTFSDEFMETPEPSTFVVLAPLIALLAFRRFRV